MISCSVELPRFDQENNGPDCEQSDSTRTLPSAFISQYAISSKMRAVSKLSSRHSRRKRLGSREKEDRSSKRYKDQIPIPTFASIASEHYDLEARGDESERVPEKESSKAPAPTPSVCRIGTDPGLIKTNDFTHTMEKIQTIQDATHGPACLNLSDGPNNDGSAFLKAPPSDNFAAVALKMNTGEVRQNGSPLDGSLSCAATSTESNIEYSPYRVTDSTPVAGKTDSHPCQLDLTPNGKQESTGVGLTIEQESDVNLSNPFISSTSNATKSFMLEESRSIHAVPQVARTIDLSNDEHAIVISRDTNENHNRSEYFRFNKTKPSDIIEVLDDDYHDVEKGSVELSRIITEVKIAPLVKNEKPSKNSRATKQRKTAISESSEEEVVNMHRRVRKVNEQRISAHGKEIPTKTKSRRNVARKKQFDALDGGKLCSACSSCNCTKRDQADQKYSTISGSDARQEQSLINRLQRLEKDIALKRAATRCSSCAEEGPTSNAEEVGGLKSGGAKGAVSRRC